MTAERTPRYGLAWRRAKRSVGNGACIEVAAKGGIISVRDSKNPDGPVLRYLSGEWNSFVIRTKQIELLVGR